MDCLQLLYNKEIILIMNVMHINNHYVIGSMIVSHGQTTFSHFLWIKKNGIKLSGHAGLSLRKLEMWVSHAFLSVYLCIQH